MISKECFLWAWEKLEARFGKQPPGMASDYKAHLSELMEEDEFIAATRAVWSTREFFPRPADFLLVRLGSDWRKLQRVVEMFRRKEDWSVLYRSISNAGRESIELLGGVFAIAERFQASVGYLRKDFGSEYENAVSMMAAESNSLPGAPVIDALPEVTPESRRIVGEVMTATENAK